MSHLSLKPTHKVINSYYNAIANLTQLDLLSEGAVAPAFSALLRHCAHQFQWTLAEQFTIKRAQKSIRVDGALIDAFKLIHGVSDVQGVGPGHRSSHGPRRGRTAGDAGTGD